MIGEKIKMLRVSQGLSQVEFAKRCYVTPGAVSQWETGRTIPDTERLMSIAKEFSIPLDYFVEGDGEKPYTEGDLIRQQVLLKIKNEPKTDEAKILAKGIDRLPKAQREQALNVVRAMFTQYASYFEQPKEGEEDDGTKL